jgi:hypothetical protein
MEEGRWCGSWNAGRLRCEGRRLGQVGFCNTWESKFKWTIWGLAFFG